MREFRERHPDAEGSLRCWFAVVAHARWRSPQEVKEAFRTADILPGGRVVFDVRADRYRVVVRFHYNTGRAYVRFVGTHSEYDEIDAETI